MTSSVPSFRPVDEGLDVVVGPQRRGHLVVAVEGAQALVGQREVVRAGLAADADAALPGAADEVDAAGRGDVQDVQPAAGQLRQRDVAVDHHLLGGGRHAVQPQPHALEALVHDAAAGQVQVLAMAEHGLVEHPAIFQGAAHDLGADDRRAVVGEGDRAAFDQAADLGQLRALAALGDGADGKDVGVAGPLGLQIDELGRRLAVEGRLGVGHAGHRRDAAGQRRRRAGGDGLVLLAARLAQVDVHVDQARADDLAGGVDHATRHEAPVAARCRACARRGSTSR